MLELSRSEAATYTASLSSETSVQSSPPGINKTSKVEQQIELPQFHFLGGVLREYICLRKEDAQPRWWPGWMHPRASSGAGGDQRRGRVAPWLRGVAEKFVYSVPELQNVPVHGRTRTNPAVSSSIC